MTAGDAASWPFWAPAELDSVHRALDLAGLAEGETVADLGCGDGQVLVAAAERGARAVGVESDPEMAELARQALDETGLEGEVVEGDLFAFVERAADVDVWFTYLAPATLQRLMPSLARHEASRLVTVDFDVPGYLADGTTDTARLYRMPGRPRRRPRTSGWTCDGALVIAAPGHQSLTLLDAHHPGGRVDADLTGELADAAAVLTGADRLEGRAALAVDLRWEDHPQGTLLSGNVVVSGLAPFPLWVLFDADAEEGCWELTDEGVENVLDHLDETGGDTDGTSFVRAAEGVDDD